MLLNVGARDGLVDGWATMDGIGLVGRISGVAQNTARVILLTDASSRIPALVQPSGQRAMVAGDNSAVPPLDFIENPDLVRPGDRVISSGDGGVFPAGLLIGQVTADPGGRLRVRLAADYERLEFLRVLRHFGNEAVLDNARLISPGGPLSDTALPLVSTPLAPAEDVAPEEAAETPILGDGIDDALRETLAISRPLARQ